MGTWDPKPYTFGEDAIGTLCPPASGSRAGLALPTPHAQGRRRRDLRPGLYNLGF